MLQCPCAKRLLRSLNDWVAARATSSLTRASGERDRLCFSITVYEDVVRALRAQFGWNVGQITVPSKGLIGALTGRCWWSSGCGARLQGLRGFLPFGTSQNFVPK